MATVSGFLARFPEFGEDRAPADLIASCLAEASRHVSTETWGDRADDGVLYWAAHLLATSPWGQQARLDPDKSSTYETAFRALQRSVVFGVAVARRVL